MSGLAAEFRKISASNPRLFRELSRASAVKVHVNPKDPLMKVTGGGYYDQGEKIVLRDKDHHVLAHEVGHAEVDKNFLGRLIQSKPSRLVANLAPAGATFAGMLARTPKGKVLSIVIPVAATLPTLGSEAWASSKGHDMLKERGATEKDLKVYKSRMLKAFLTYTQLPILSALGGAAGILASKS